MLAASSIRVSHLPNAFIPQDEHIVWLRASRYFHRDHTVESENVYRTAQHSLCEIDGYIHKHIRRLIARAALEVGILPHLQLDKQVTWGKALRLSLCSLLLHAHLHARVHSRRDVHFDGARFTHLLELHAVASTAAVLHWLPHCIVELDVLLAAMDSFEERDTQGGLHVFARSSTYASSTPHRLLKEVHQIFRINTLSTIRMHMKPSVTHTSHSSKSSESTESTESSKWVTTSTTWGSLEIRIYTNMPVCVIQLPFIIITEYLVRF
mmetsp:Transcript_28269/g.47529  ORF Transcript_28269/g.47529 Transcript_28269/m.47529 type:complete len:266 (+) Transcript_28269:545-1342(+)